MNAKKKKRLMLILVFESDESQVFYDMLKLPKLLTIILHVIMTNSCRQETHSV